jgi:hypothetical protein
MITCLWCSNPSGELDGFQASSRDCGFGAINLCFGSDKHTDFRGLETFFDELLHPVAYSGGFFFGGVVHVDLRFGTVENRNGVLARFGIAVHVGQLRREQPVGLTADLVRSAIVDPQGDGTSAHIHTQCFP